MSADEVVMEMVYRECTNCYQPARKREKPSLEVAPTTLLFIQIHVYCLADRAYISHSCLVTCIHSRKCFVPVNFPYVTLNFDL